MNAGKESSTEQNLGALTFFFLNNLGPDSNFHLPPSGHSYVPMLAKKQPRNVFLIYNLNPLVAASTHYFFSAPLYTYRTVDHHPLYNSPFCIWRLIQSLLWLYLFLSRLSNSSSSNPPSCHVLSTNFLWSSLGTFSKKDPHLSSTEVPKTGHRNSRESSTSDEYSGWITSCDWHMTLLLMNPSILVFGGFLNITTLLTHVRFTVHTNTQALFCNTTN